MSITPDSFFNFAESTFNNAKDEFDYRNSASRAYYCAFHCCNKERMRGPGIKDDVMRGSHDKLYDFFAALPVEMPEAPLLKKMAYMARLMKSVRKHADYNLQNDFCAQDSKQQVSDARKVLSTWKQLQTLFP